MKIRKHLKKFSILALVIFLNQLAFPTYVLALTGGPTQPEVHGFEPIGTNQMVDLFSGDFTYNIPLFDIGGYPINMAYHSGTGMEQEASWVGLGWSLTPGAISRNLRGLPDDFKEEEIKFTRKMKPNHTIGLDLAFDPELAGVELGEKAKAIFGDDTKLSLGMGVTYNNYTGIDINKSVSVSFSNGVINPSVGYSDNGGLSVSAKPSLAALVKNRDKDSKTGKNALGKLSSFADLDGEISWNSSAGLGMSIDGNIKGKLGEKLGRKSKFQRNILNTEKVYSPGSDVSMWNYGFRVNVGLGAEAFIADAQGQADFFYNVQRLGGFGEEGDVEGNVAEWSLKAYGTEYGHESSADHTNDLLDFNREHEYPLRDESPLLPVSQLTYDMFSVSGQGTGGSFRNYRNDFPLVGKNRVSDAPNTQVNIGLDISAIQLVKVGGNGSLLFSESRNGFWNTGLDDLKSNIGFEDEDGSDWEYEPTYFKKGGEYGAFDEAYLAEIGGEQAVNFELESSTTAGNMLQVSGTDLSTLSNADFKNNRDYARAPRASAILALTKDEAHNYGFPYAKEFDRTNKIIDYDGHNNDEQLDDLSGYADGTYLDRKEDMPGKDHHYGEFQITQDDGYRYVYGLPVYNHKTVEASFAIELEESQSDPNLGNGYVTYDPEDPTEENEKGRDNFLSKKEIPAYAHSFMLTAILSPDYVDVTGNGITDDDIGEAVMFNYEKVFNEYGWRNPTTGTANQGRYMQGLKTLDYDDKASYVYGTKEVWILHSIESKNMVAEFYTSDRNDGLGVADESGTKDDTRKQRKLDRIVLSNKIDRAKDDAGHQLTPIKTVFFKYNYSLCDGISNSADGTGKLTLTELGFSYGRSGLGMLSPYKFSYSDVNPDYHPLALDRWGNYMRMNSAKPNHEFPYSNQNATEADEDASAWLLNSIDLPSGGTISVEYEADDYAYVMDKHALSMKDIAGVGKTKDFTAGTKLYESWGKESNFLYFELPAGTYDNDDDVKADFEPEGGNLYYKGFFHVKGEGSNDPTKDEKEYVSGYVRIMDMGLCPWTSGTKYGYVEIEEKKDGNLKYQAMSHAAWKMMLGSFPDKIDNMPNAGENLLETGKDFILSQLGKITEILKGRMGQMKNGGFAQHLDLSKSIIRLKEPTGFKKGGGTRVKQITMTDNWNNMTNQEEDASEFGSVYTYTTYEDGRDISSGVAAYEPMMGSEENPFKQPIYFKYRPKNIMGLVKVGNEIEDYVVGPYGEMFFPGASVGYSEVKVQSLATKRIADGAISGSATGYTVSEFFTTKDFPVVVDKTTPQQGNNPLKNALLKLFTNTTKKDLAMSQGYSVIVNNMHGKPERTTNYNAIHVPVSSQEYVYKTDVTDPSKLDNHVKVLQRDGTILSSRQVGVEVDFVADAHESINRSYQTRIQPGSDGFTLGIPPFIAIPNMWFKYKGTTSNLRFVSNTKVIYKYGIIDKVIARDETSVVHTENLLWDEETGQVLLTRTYNEYDDPLENFTLPAHFKYSGMQGAYKNLDITIPNVAVANGVYQLPSLLPNKSVEDYFEPGDEVALILVNSAGVMGHDEAWVLDVDTDNDRVFLIDRYGEAIETKTYNELRILRSGKRNQTNAAILSIASNGDILTQISNQEINDVIDAGSADFNEAWKTYCDRLVAKSSNVTDDLPKVLNCLWNKSETKSYYGPEDGINLDYDCNLNLVSDLRDQARRKSNIDFLVYTSTGVTLYYYKVEVIGGDPIDIQGSIFNAQVNIQDVIDQKDVNGNVISSTYYTSSYMDPNVDPDGAGPLKSIFETAFIDDGGASSWQVLTSHSEPRLKEKNVVREVFRMPYFRLNYEYIPGQTHSEILIGVGALDVFDDMNRSVNRQAFIPQHVACEFKLIPTTPATVIDPTEIDEFTGMSYSEPTVQDPDGIYTMYADMKGGGTQEFILENECLDLMWDQPIYSCGDMEQGDIINPYVAGVRGNWRPISNWIYHTGRTSSLTAGAVNSQSHTNIRTDGELENFSLEIFNPNTPYLMDVMGAQWVSPNFITEYTPDGSEIENRDILGRYSSEVFGYDRRVVVAAANNAQHHNIAFDGFEEYLYPFHQSCRKSQHWAMSNFSVPSEYFPPALGLSGQYHEYGPGDFSEEISDEDAHTGHFSLKIEADNSFYTDDLVKDDCTPINQTDMSPFQLSDCDCIGYFEPDANSTYFISAWVKETGHISQPGTYTNTRMKIHVLDDNQVLMPAYTITLEPSGPITDGWQRITGEFELPVGTGLTLRTEVIADAGMPGPAYLDDVRIQPFNSQMKSYVYDYTNLRLMAELDENNYATYYEYDAEGKLLRIKKETEKGVMTIQESRYGISQ